MENFIDVVRSRKTSDLYGPIEEGHVSSALCHLGNISHRIGMATPEGQLREKIKGSSGVSEAHGRMVEHLAANNCDLAQTQLTLGVPLLVDPKAERFAGTETQHANSSLSRQCR